MSRLPVPSTAKRIAYPTSDGKPMAETDIHRDLMLALIETLKTFYAAEALVYVSGNLLLCYEEGNRRKHVSPDVFVVRGVPKHERENYLSWEEGQSPRFVIELTSSSTRREDTDKKFVLYRDVLKVREYFLFDPMVDYLKPSMQGWRLRGGVYHPIRAVGGRLPSLTTGLHLEGDGNDLRLWNPQTETWLPTPAERADEAEARADDALTLAIRRIDRAVARADEAIARAIARADEAVTRAARAEAELRRLRERYGVTDEAS